MHRAVAVLSVLLAAISFGSLSAQLPDQLMVVFSGIPEKRVIIGPNGVVEADLSSSEREEYKVIIACGSTPETALWATRDFRTMIRSDNAGVFTVFHAVDGIGYVKMIRKPSEGGAVLDLALTAGGGGDAYTYVEHFSTGFSSVTYFGTAESRGDLPTCDQ